MGLFFLLRLVLLLPRQLNEWKTTFARHCDTMKINITGRNLKEYVRNLWVIAWYVLH